MKLAIVTDSTSDLPVEIAALHHIEVVPQHILWRTQSYLDGIELKVADFYERLAHESEMPKTSQPAPGDFAAAYQHAREVDNADAVLCVTLSSTLSGTYNSAEAARALVDFPVQVVDSRSVTMGLGFAVLAAAHARDQGATLAEAAEAAAETGKKAQVFFTVNTLEFLHRGGRIGNTQRLIGTALSIKPIFQVYDGQVRAAERVRTRKRALARMLELARCAQSGMVQVAILHGAAEAESDAFADEVQHTVIPACLFRSTICSTLGVHTGPGVVGIAITTASTDYPC